VKRCIYLAGGALLALTMLAAAAVPSFAAGTPPVDPPEVTDPDYGIMPLSDLYSSTCKDTSGQWNSSEFAAIPAYGSYIRYWHQNDTNEKVKVYLYRTDISTTKYVSMMYVEPHSQNSSVYFSLTSNSGTYKIVVEAFASGGDVNGSVAAAQYKTHPNVQG